jgi:hypothetical protein
MAKLLSDDGSQQPELLTSQAANKQCTFSAAVMPTAQSCMTCHLRQSRGATCVDPAADLDDQLHTADIEAPGGHISCHQHTELPSPEASQSGLALRLSNITMKGPAGHISQPASQPSKESDNQERTATAGQPLAGAQQDEEQAGAHSNTTLDLLEPNSTQLALPQLTELQPHH